MVSSQARKITVTLPEECPPGTLMSIPVSGEPEPIQLRVPPDMGPGSTLFLIQPEGSDEWIIEVGSVVPLNEAEFFDQQQMQQRQMIAEEERRMQFAEEQRQAMIAEEERRIQDERRMQMIAEEERRKQQMVTPPESIGTNIVGTNIVGGPGPSQAEAFTVRLETTVGIIDIIVRPDWAPYGARRFLELASSGDLDQLCFYRAIEGCIAQFGLPAKRRWEPIPDDPQSGVPFLLGAVSFAAVGENSRKSTLFICTGDMSHCLGQKSWEIPIGAVSESSLDVLDRIDCTYGDIAEFRGNGPDTSRINAEGNAYLKTNFPRLTYIVRACSLDWRPDNPQDVNSYLVRNEDQLQRTLPRDSQIPNSIQMQQSLPRESPISNSMQLQQTLPRDSQLMNQSMQGIGLQQLPRESGFVQSPPQDRHHSFEQAQAVQRAEQAMRDAELAMKSAASARTVAEAQAAAEIAARASRVAKEAQQAALSAQASVESSVRRDELARSSRQLVPSGSFVQAPQASFPPTAQGFAVLPQGGSLKMSSASGHQPKVMTVQEYKVQNATSAVELYEALRGDDLGSFASQQPMFTPQGFTVMPQGGSLKMSVSNGQSGQVLQSGQIVYESSGLMTPQEFAAKQARDQANAGMEFQYKAINPSSSSSAVPAIPPPVTGFQDISNQMQRLGGSLTFVASAPPMSVGAVQLPQSNVLPVMPGGGSITVPQSNVLPVMPGGGSLTFSVAPPPILPPMPQGGSLTFPVTAPVSKSIGVSVPLQAAPQVYQQAAPQVLQEVYHQAPQVIQEVQYITPQGNILPVMPNTGGSLNFPVMPNTGGSISVSAVSAPPLNFPVMPNTGGSISVSAVAAPPPQVNSGGVTVQIPQYGRFS